MKIKDFDFGAEDARNLSLLSEGDKDSFLMSFVLPETFDIEKFYNGRKNFVYGGKGSGKTALLQYIRIQCEREIQAITQFYYFQSTFSESELAKFRGVLNRGGSVCLNSFRGFLKWISAWVTLPPIPASAG